MPDAPVFQITLGDFSGPLDLLCHLVESQAMDASQVRLTEVLSQYVTYLFSARKATLAELAEFFSLASRILLRKVRSLLPRAEDEAADEAFAEACGEEAADPEEMDEETLRVLLERFRPYRNAAVRLLELKNARDRYFVRVSEEGGPPWFDIGDLYSLATLWWTLIEEHSRHRAAGTASGFLLEVPDAVPEEVLVEARMEEIERQFQERERTTLRELLVRFGGAGLIVTLLALLELSRLGRLNLLQEETWGDVTVAIARSV